METFSFVDIFSTKGIEYIFVIGFLVLLVLFLYYLEKPKRSANFAEAISPFPAYWFRLMHGRYYHQGHTWVRPEGKEFVKVGLDDFAQLLMGKPESIKLPEVGSTIEQGETGWQMEIEGKKIPMLSPITGKVVEINEKVLDTPSHINSDPYNEGWLLKIQVPSIKKNLNNLLSGKMAFSWMEKATETLTEKMTGELGILLQDGGTLISGFAKQLSPENWEEIASEFFMTT